MAAVATQRLFARLHVQLRLVYAAAPGIWRGTIHRECVQSFRLQPAIGAQVQSYPLLRQQCKRESKARRDVAILETPSQNDATNCLPENSISCPKIHEICAI